MRRGGNTVLIQRNWLLGKRIYEEQLKGEDRAEYGKRVISELSKQLAKAYGRGFEPRTLYRFVYFDNDVVKICPAAHVVALPCAATC